MSTTRNYTCLQCVRAGALAMPGQSIALSDEDAATLLSRGAIKLTDPETTTSISDSYKLECVVKAIGELDADNEALFTKDGTPKTDVLSDAVSFDVSAALRDEAVAKIAELAE